VIAEHLGESAMYGGAIAGRGPRYCPSVEDKILRFPDAARHQLFLEPEGLETRELYVNGLSTSLPTPVQLRVLRTVRGLEHARMTRAGYAIEYDYYPPTQLDATLRVRALEGLWFAGQINGTTGYEEAAAQGTVAGLNAALWVQERPPLVLGRETSYVAVLADDLVTRGSTSRTGCSRRARSSGSPCGRTTRCGGCRRSRSRSGSTPTRSGPWSPGGSRTRSAPRRSRSG
jgi:tRNA uridine 5-carboxymethylaminomethyl modification enzyme